MLVCTYWNWIDLLLFAATDPTAQDWTYCTTVLCLAVAGNLSLTTRFSKPIHKSTATLALLATDRASDLKPSHYRCSILLCSADHGTLEVRHSWGQRRYRPLLFSQNIILCAHHQDVWMLLISRYMSTNLKKQLPVGPLQHMFFFFRWVNCATTVLGKRSFPKFGCCLYMTAHTPFTADSKITSSLVSHPPHLCVVPRIAAASSHRSAPGRWGLMPPRDPHATATSSCRRAWPLGPHATMGLSCYRHVFMPPHAAPWAKGWGEGQQWERERGRGYMNSKFIGQYLSLKYNKNHKSILNISNITNNISHISTSLIL